MLAGVPVTPRRKLMDTSWPRLMSMQPTDMCSDIEVLSLTCEKLNTVIIHMREPLFCVNGHDQLLRTSSPAFAYDVTQKDG